MKIIKKFFKWLFYFVIIVAIVYRVTLWYVDRHIEDRVAKKEVFSDYHKIWSSRGMYGGDIKQNSLESFAKAIDAGYIGFEVDFYYEPMYDRFVVSHDRAINDDGKPAYNLKDGKLLTLEVLFRTLGEGKYFWLDYKNLDRLNKVNTQKAIQRLDKISKTNHIKDRLYLEGCTPWTLNKYEDAGFKTLLSFHPLPKSHILTSLSSNFFKIVYYFSKSTALAMQYGKYDNPKYNKITQKNLKGIPQFLFHVPTDTTLLQNLVSLDDVRMLLAGRDESVDFTRLNTQK